MVIMSLRGAFSIGMRPDIVCFTTRKLSPQPLQVKVSGYSDPMFV
jgi:hypothetical protein